MVCVAQVLETLDAKKPEVERIDMNILITSAYKRMALVKQIIDEQRGLDTNAKVFACDMNPAGISSIADFDGCFKVPICTSGDYVE